MQATVEGNLVSGKEQEFNFECAECPHHEITRGDVGYLTQRCGSGQGQNFGSYFQGVDEIKDLDKIAYGKNKEGVRGISE